MVRWYNISVMNCVTVHVIDSFDWVVGVTCSRFFKLMFWSSQCSFRCSCRCFKKLSFVMLAAKCSRPQVSRRLQKHLLYMWSVDIPTHGILTCIEDPGSCTHSCELVDVPVSGMLSVYVYLDPCQCICNSNPSSISVPGTLPVYLFLEGCLPARPIDPREKEGGFATISDMDPCLSRSINVAP